MNVLTLMNYAATLMNCVIIWTTSSQQINNLIGEGSQLRNIQFLLAIEHTLICVKYALESIIPDVPYWVHREIKRYQFIEEQEKDSDIQKKFR